MKWWLCLFLFFLQINSAIALTFEEMAAHMQYLATRDMVLSKNIANVNTPSYLPKDLDKSSHMESGLSLMLTNGLHIPADSAPDLDLYHSEVLELKPNGNGVTAEHELSKKNDNSQNIKELANLFAKHKHFLQTAISGAVR